MTDLVGPAIEYIQAGLPVIALTGKTPNGVVHRRGLHDALTEVDLHDRASAVRYAFTHQKTTGIGIVIPYPYVVVDIDSEVGAENWKALVGEEFMPDRWAAKTAHGLHLWFSCVQPTGTFKPFGKDGGVDLKAQGGYVAVEPSWHPGYPDEGIEAGPLYRWLLPPWDEPNGPIEAPAPLLRAIADHAFAVEGRLISKQQGKRVRHMPFEGGKLWASFGFDHLYDGMRSAGEGNRNAYLHWAAATMAEEGATDEEYELLKAAAHEAGLTRIETRRTIRSGRTRG